MENVNIKQYNRMSLLEIVYTQIKKDILMGKYKPGERLVISNFSAELGVSHTPINASLNRLVMEGFVEFIPRKGMRIKSINVKDIIEIYEARKMCELYSADNMIKIAQDDKSYLQELEEIHKVMFESGYDKAKEDGFFSYFEGEKKFHMKTVSACENDRILNIYSGLNANSLYFYKISFDSTPYDKSRYNDTRKEHESILDGIKQSDLYKLKDALNSHINLSVEYIYEHASKTI